MLSYNKKNLKCKASLIDSIMICYFYDFKILNANCWQLHLQHVWLYSILILFQLLCICDHPIFVLNQGNYLALSVSLYYYKNHNAANIRMLEITNKKSYTS